MKIIEAVRLGVFCGTMTAMGRKVFRGLFGVVARSAAGLAFALWLTIAVAVPAVASEDWKEEVISGWTDILAAVSEKAKVSELPNAEFSMAYTVYNGMSGFCAKFSDATGIPTPESVIELSAAIHNDFMRGKAPLNESVVRLGKLCLDHGEQSYIKYGVSHGLSQEKAKSAVEDMLAPIMIESFQQIRKNLGL